MSVTATQALGIIPGQVTHLVTYDYLTGMSNTDCGIRVHVRTGGTPNKRAIQWSTLPSQATCPDCVPMHQFDVDVALIGECECGEPDCTFTNYEAVHAAHYSPDATSDALNALYNGTEPYECGLCGDQITDKMIDVDRTHACCGCGYRDRSADGTQWACPYCD